MWRLALTCLALLSIGGCETIVLGGASLGIQHFKMFQNPDINLKAKNYAATDYLISRAKTYLQSGDTIVLNALVNSDDPATPAEIGRIIPQDIGERLIQLGYPVDMSSVSNLENVVDKKLPAPDYIISGSYHVDHPNIHVRLKMTGAQSGRVRAVFDYVMPTNRSIRELATPEAQIIRIER